MDLTGKVDFDISLDSVLTSHQGRPIMPGVEIATLFVIRSHLSIL